jgi:hypothetical protein
VLLFWIIVACGLAVGGGLALSGTIAFFSGRAANDRRRAVHIARWMPAMGFAYLLLCLLAFSGWSTLRGRDRGWGDTWQTPVLGNYSLRMVAVTDHGTIFDRTDSEISSRGSIGSTLGHRDVIFGVRRLEVRAPFLLGTAAPGLSTGASHDPETLFFILDTRTGNRIDEDSLPALEAAAEKLGGPLNLRPVKEIYGQLRYGKADLIPLFAFVIPPVLGSWLLGRWFLRLRREDRHSGMRFPSSRRDVARPAGLYLCSVDGVRRSPVKRYR